MSTAYDEQYMQRALDLAALALGRTSPNPVVGAVIVQGDKIVGEGYHQKAGTEHAEIHALRQAGNLARGATVYVTLEPCSHYGKTPPCADALIAAGVSRVVAAVLDPNPLISGQGMEKLKRAGIETQIGVLAEPAQRLNEVFFKYITTDRPFIAMKTAMTLDGKIATFQGNSKWITSAPAREYVHQLRNRYDGIMVGIGTVIADDPRLNTRLNDTDVHDPVRIIIDGELLLPITSQIVKTSRQQRTLVFTSHYAEPDREERLKSYGVEVIRTDGKTDQLDLNRIMHYLGQQGITSVLIEGGAGLNASLWEHGLVDKVYWFIAPKIVGGVKAPGPIAGAGIPVMNEAIELTNMRVEQVGTDLLIEAYPRW